MDDFSSLLVHLRDRVRRKQFSKILKQAVPRSGSAQNFSIDPLATYMDGYLAASETDPAQLTRHLNVDDEMRKRILIEGAFASAATQDLLMPAEQNRTEILLSHLPVSNVVMYQGLGAAFGATDLKSDTVSQLVKTFFGFMCFDCYGFYKGYFDWTDTLEKTRIPEQINGPARYAFDCGVGRAIWWISGANPAVAAELINRFNPSRRGPMWSGVGLYLALFGGIDNKEIKKLRRLATSNAHNLQEGIGLGIFILNDAGSSPSHISSVSQLICGAKTQEVLRVAQDNLKSIPGDALDAKHFTQWKHNMATFFAQN